MTITKIVLLAFILLEFSNVVALYFFPGSRRANAVGVFSAWEKSKQFPEIHDLMRYLVNWVAGTKLIFLFLLGLIVVFADLNLQKWSLVALGLATLTFYWRMFPLARKMDQEGQIQPKNYSLVLGGMILVLILLFFLAASIRINI
jgi:hypothetical protein